MTAPFNWNTQTDEPTAARHAKVSRLCEFVVDQTSSVFGIVFTISPTGDICFTSATRVESLTSEVPRLLREIATGVEKGLENGNVKPSTTRPGEAG